MDKPINDPLRTFTMLELLDRAFRIYRNNFLTFIGLAAVVIVPLTAFNYLLTAPVSTSLERSMRAGGSFSTASNSALLNNLLGAYGVLAIAAVVTTLVQGVLLAGPLTYMASEQHMGRRVTIGEAFSAVRSRLARVGLGLVVFYVILGGTSLILAFTLFVCGLGIGILAYLGVTLYAFLTPVLILERTSLMDGLGRAWMLGKARVWPVSGLMFVIFLISVVLNVALTLTIQLITQQNVASVSFGASQALEIVLQAIIAVFLAPVLPIGLTLMYYDTRVRVEGLDIALQATGKPDPRPADVMSPPAHGFMTGRDYGNVGIMCAVIFGLIVLYFAASYFLVIALSRSGGGL